MPPLLREADAQAVAQGAKAQVDIGGLRAINHTYLGLQTAAFMWHAVRGGDSLGATLNASAATSIASDTALAAGTETPYDSTTDPLQLLASLTGDFPRMAPHLQSLPVPPRLVQSVRMAARSIGFGQNVVLVNGRAVDVTAASFNYFRLLRTLQDEASVLASFGKLPLDESDQRRLREVSAAAAGQ